MMGLERSTVSPCSSSMSRSTPWVLGCWGPMLMIMVSSSGTSSSPSSVASTAGAAGCAASASDRRSTAPTSIIRSTASVTWRLVSSWPPSEVWLESAKGSWASDWPLGFVVGSWVVVMAASVTGIAHRTVGAPLNCTGMRPDVVVLAQRVAHPVLGHEDAGHVGVTVEDDAEHVEHLALHGLGAGVDGEQRRAGGIVARHLHPQADALALAVRHEGDHHLEALGLDALGQRPTGMGQVVDAGHVQARQVALVVQRPHQLDQLVAAGVQHALAPGPADGHAVELLGFRGRLGRDLGVGDVAHRLSRPRSAPQAATGSGGTARPGCRCRSGRRAAR